MDVKEILKKVEESPVPQVKKVALAYSGGLDSTLGIEMLRRKYKAQGNRRRSASTSARARTRSSRPAARPSCSSSKRT